MHMNHAPPSQFPHTPHTVTCCCHSANTLLLYLRQYKLKCMMGFLSPLALRTPSTSNLLRYLCFFSIQSQSCYFAVMSAPVRDAQLFLPLRGSNVV